MPQTKWLIKADENVLLIQSSSIGSVLISLVVRFVDWRLFDAGNLLPDLTTLIVVGSRVKPKLYLTSPPMSDKVNE